MVFFYLFGLDCGDFPVIVLAFLREWLLSSVGRALES